MSLFVLTLSEDSSSTPDAKKGLNFGIPGSSSDQEELQGNEVAAGVVHAIPVANLGLTQLDPFRSYKSFRNFSAWFCTTRTPKLLAWLKNVLIRHTFVLKFVQNEGATKELHINQAKVNFNSGFDIIFDNIDSKLERRYMSKDNQTLTSIEQTIKIVKNRIL